MANKISILFYVKSAKASKNGTVPIYLRVTIDGTRMDFSTGTNTEPAKWSSQSGRMKGNSVEACSINTHLESMKIKVYSIESVLLKTDRTVTPEIFKNKFLGIEEQKRTIMRKDTGKL
ncbi:Arm DNA-binding domain-containing protein [Flavobacterium pallidum]|uniref:Arm DNA-binding domain-containing protein n=1 Tax=Flavobacterium pallidum TaxID=2172098 RepID=A0A2S1SK72_9FLAO|nr:Arm DNA-binding domain-containing protein [Flavobacterium pallidum]AWI26769.1 hypothetical protein HYN49_13175 [Flavobacterium pallidum]